MQIGLFFGSFNPPHIGHIIVANHLLEYTRLEKIWFVVSPENPFKNPADLLNEKERLFMTELAIKGYKNMEVCDIELQLARPSYTIDTLNVLEKRYPRERFQLIMGADLVKDFPRWKEADLLGERYKPYVYPRFPLEPLEKRNLKAHYIKAPLIEISASFIREALKKGKCVRPLLPLSVWEYIVDGNLYQR